MRGVSVSIAAALEDRARRRLHGGPAIASPVAARRHGEHWREPVWIDPQLRYLRRFAPADTKVWASLDGISDEHFGRFDAAMSLSAESDDPVRHTDKLNELARRITVDAEPDDRLLFLDGDTFPIAPLRGIVRRARLPDRGATSGECRRSAASPLFHAHDGPLLERHRRRLGKGLRLAELAWHVGNQASSLLRELRKRDLGWRELLRMNTTDLHPLYRDLRRPTRRGPVVYHHGAGFHTRRSRADDAPKPAIIPNRVPVLGRAERSLRWRLRKRKISGTRHQQAAARQDEQVRAWIAQDDNIADRFV